MANSNSEYEDRELDEGGGIKYPNVNVRLVGEDGNAFAIMGRVTNALRRAGAGSVAITEFRDEAMSGDYDNLLRTVMAWVNTDGDEEDEDYE